MFTLEWTIVQVFAGTSFWEAVAI